MNKLQINVVFLCVILFLGSASINSKSKQPPPIEQCAEEPVKYVGSRQPDNRFYDGRLPHVFGVHHYQAFRANRTYPSEGSEIGWTYNHQPFLAYWQGKFYLQYLSDMIQEHTPPGRTLLITSKDGRHWSDPVVIFPQYELPEIKFDDIYIPAGTKSVMHQRMGFYVAPNGKLLTLAFYSYCATPRNSPNAGNGLGRVVREIKDDGSLGSIYFIRYNRHVGFNESNTKYPSYKTSDDTNFVAACESLLSNKLITLQWWEEDRAEDGFYVINPGDVANAAYFSAKITTSKGAGKAFNFFHRPDGVVVGLWKNQWSALSPDDGLSWTKITQNKSLWTCGAKTWGQRTEDGKYAIVHNQSPTRRNRFPMVIITGDNGHTFDNMLCVRGEVPLKRYQGLHKNTGPQYYRGIVEGNGDPPGTDMWVTYSVNKEDIWIAKIKVPIRQTEIANVNQNFDYVETEKDLKWWNLYIPQWAPVRIARDTSTTNKYLELKDEEPYDYAMVERILPTSRHLELKFRFNAQKVAQGHALEVEVQDREGTRPMRLRIDQNWLGIDRKQVSHDPIPIQTEKWYDVRLLLDCKLQKYDLEVNGNIAIQNIAFAEQVESLERLVFRTGPYRGFVPPAFVEDAMPKPAGLESEDLPGADEKVEACVYLIDDVYTKSK